MITLLLSFIDVFRFSIIAIIFVHLLLGKRQS
jgi:hypothetical protein